MFFCNFLPKEAVLRVHLIFHRHRFRAPATHTARTLGERKSNEMFEKGAFVLPLIRSFAPLHSFSSLPKVLFVSDCSFGKSRQAGSGPGWMRPYLGLISGICWLNTRRVFNH